MSATVTLGYRLAQRATPAGRRRGCRRRARRSRRPAPVTGAPSTSVHCSASHASVAVESSAAGRPRRSRRAAATAARPGRPCPTSGSAACPRRRAAAPARRAAPRAAGRCAAAQVEVAVGCGHDVADEHLVAGRGRLHGGGGAGDPGQRLQGGVDLAELDPPAAELDLLVGAADEDAAPRARARTRSPLR